MKYIIIGTAGHVDHGKSALIKALTGKDTDRLKEEKQRGISIDLGFASLPLAEDIRAGIVDVPGHERFLKNMLAGTGSIDMAMLVIAADEGVMPQTREHLAMLQLLGIESGIVVVNKIDKVEADWLELVEEDIKAFLQDTSWKQAPVCRVSAITGQGLEELRQMLAQVAAGVSARDSGAPFRLWIDRSFSVKGHGAVVTGSVMSGSANVGDSLCLYPEGRLVRIRGLETHGSKVNTIYAGQRAAINITGVEQEEIARGMSLSTPNCSQSSSVWDIGMNWQQEVPSGTRVRLHLGTGEFLGRLHQFKNAPAAYMRLILEEPLYAAAGDKGIVRLYSPQHLLGGAVLIAPGTNSRRLTDSRRLLAEAIANNDYHSMVEHILAEAGLPVAADAVRQRLGYICAGTADCLLAQAVKNEKIQKIDSFYIARQSLRELDSKLAGLLGTYHRQYSDRPGLSCQVIRQKLNLEEKAFDALLVHWLQSGLIAVAGGEMALKEHAAKHAVWQLDIRSKAEQALSDTDITDIDVNLLAEKMALNPAEAKAVFDALVRGGVLLKVADMHVYRKTMQYIIGLLQTYFQNNSTVTVAELRTLLNTSRKMAVPLIEYLDVNKYTIREGDARRPSQKLRDFSE